MNYNSYIIKVNTLDTIYDKLPGCGVWYDIVSFRAVNLHMSKILRFMIRNKKIMQYC